MLEESSLSRAACVQHGSQIKGIAQMVDTGDRAYQVGFSNPAFYGRHHPLGVSPAFVVSRFDKCFTLADYDFALGEIAALGFSCFQPEIYTADALPAWFKGGASRLARRASDLGLGASQFVAHFLLEGFAAKEPLAVIDDDELSRVVECVLAFDGCRVVTVPMAPFASNCISTTDTINYDDLWKRLVDKVSAFLDIVLAAGLNLALEILPASLVGNVDGFLRLAAEIDSPRLGVNLDTGHARATCEVIPLLPSKLRGRIFGVHLKDVDGDRGESRVPGRGTIPWVPFLQGLHNSGYNGSLDIEIFCASEMVASEYAAGREYLRKLGSTCA